MIKAYFSALRYIKKKMYKRHVSLGDLIFSREDTARFYGFGEGTTCYNNVLIIGDVTVGKNCWIGPNVILDGSGGLYIGDNCTISSGAHIYSHNSIYKNDIQHKPTKIENNVYIGPNAVIQMGVCIEQDSIVGALSFVNKNMGKGTKWLGTDKANAEKRA